MARLLGGKMAALSEHDVYLQLSIMDFVETTRLNENFVSPSILYTFTMKEVNFLPLQ